MTWWTTAGDFLLLSSIHELYVRRCMTQWPCRSALAPMCLFLSVSESISCPVTWYIMSHSTTSASSSSSNNPLMVQFFMGRISLSPYTDEERETGFELGLPYFAIRRAKAFRHSCAKQVTKPIMRHQRKRCRIWMCSRHGNQKKLYFSSPENKAISNTVTKPRTGFVMFGKPSCKCQASFCISFCSNAL